MPSYFDNLEDTEISGGEFTSVAGDFVGAGGVRQGAVAGRVNADKTTYFANAKGLKITGGNFMSFGGDFHGGHSRSQYAPAAPVRPPPVPLAPHVPHYEIYGEYGYHYPQRPAMHPPPPPPPPPPSQVPYNYYGGEYGDLTGSHSMGYHYPYPVQPAPPPPQAPSATHTNVIRPSLLHSQSGPTPGSSSTGGNHLNANLSASVEFTHTRTEPHPPSHTEHHVRPPSGLDVPNHRPINPNPTINIWAQRPGEVEEYIISDSDSDDERQKKKKKKKGGMSSMTELSHQFRRVFTKNNE